MRLAIDPALQQRCPALRVACVQGSVQVSKSADALLELMNARAAQLSGSAASADIASNPEIIATRQAYKVLGKDPSRYRGSAEALLRRLASGKGLYFINNLVDINNLVSLGSFLPVGSYDLANVGDEIVFRIGREGESYKGIGKDVINIADLPVFADRSGPFGSPSSDSERAMIRETTTSFAMMIISFSGSSDLNTWASRAVELVRDHAGGSELGFEIVES
jgi:DNA/RNA-binding domain of Phe-tRNA-synthetase-like protein